MSADKACYRCCFWALTQDERTDHPYIQTERAACLRHAPVAVEVNVLKGCMPRWPTTEGIDWCGDFVAGTHD